MAAVLFTKLLKEYKTEEGLPFPAYKEYLPLRIKAWLDGQMFHQEGGKRVLKRFEPLDESMRQIDWQPTGTELQCMPWLEEERTPSWPEFVDGLLAALSQGGKSLSKMGTRRGGMLPPHG